VHPIHLQTFIFSDRNGENGRRRRMGSEALLRLITFKCNCSHTSRNIVKIQIFGKQ